MNNMTNEMKTDSFVSYQVELDPSSLEIKVSMNITGNVAKGKDGKLLLELPAWVPGDYEFEPYGRDIFSVTAYDSNGDTIQVKRYCCVVVT